MAGTNRRCTANPVLAGVNSSTFAVTEAVASQFHTVGLARLLNERLTTWTQRPPRSNAHARVEATQPLGRTRWDVLPLLASCGNRLSRLQSSPKRWDGSTHVCSLRSLNEGCVVLSVGSNNVFEFESQIVRRTPCSIEICDCTVDTPRMPAAVAARARFHKLCLGRVDSMQGGMQFVSYSSLVHRLGLRRVDILRLDIEGHEFDSVLAMIEAEHAAAARRHALPLPFQLVTELHYQHGDGHESLPWAGRYLTMGELAMLANALYATGYRVVHREINPKWPQCAEFTLVRYRCPGLQLMQAALGWEWPPAVLAPPPAVSARCVLVVHCTTGVGDRVFDIVAGVAALQLARGCRMPTVHVADKERQRSYNWSRIVRSSEFTIEPRPFPMPAPNVTAMSTQISDEHPLHMGGVLERKCGQHGIQNWLGETVQRELGGVSQSALKDALRRVARSVHVDGASCKRRWPDLAERVGIHLRRGDKLHLRAWNATNLSQTYDAALTFLEQRGARKVFLATDDDAFGATFARRLRSRGVDVAYEARASAASDLCALASCNLVVKASTASQFASLAAAISGAPLVSFASKRGRAMDHRWRRDGLLTSVIELGPGAGQERELPLGSAPPPNRTSALRSLWWRSWSTFWHMVSQPTLVLLALCCCLPYAVLAAVRVLLPKVW
jgi:hypothetical protein